MSDEQPASKRTKISDTKTESDIEPKPGPSSATFDTEERKRKVPKAEAPVTTFFDLDDECQSKIWSHLSLNDLGAMAEVSVQYKEAAQRVFASKYRNLHISSLIETEGGKFNLLQARRLLYNFGHLIESLTINLDMLHDRARYAKLLGLVNKYSIDTINKLTFEGQPGGGRFEDMPEFVGVSLLGMQLMMNGSQPGPYHTRNTTIYRRGRSKQIQELHRLEVDN